MSKIWVDIAFDEKSKYNQCKTCNILTSNTSYCWKCKKYFCREHKLNVCSKCNKCIDCVNHDKCNLCNRFSCQNCNCDNCKINICSLCQTNINGYKYCTKCVGYCKNCRKLSLIIDRELNVCSNCKIDCTQCHKSFVKSSDDQGCYICLQTKCRTCAPLCVDCNTYHCVACYKTCDKCGNHSTNYQSCDTCNKNVCNNCCFRCKCKKFFCCYKNCSNCGLKTCGKHNCCENNLLKCISCDNKPLFTCTYCKSYYCMDCSRDVSVRLCTKCYDKISL